MKNEFNFATFCNILEEKKVTEIEGNIAKNYIYRIIQNELCLTSIDFSKFSFEDLIEVYRGLDTLITDEDTDGSISIDPNHTYTQVLALKYKVSRLGELPKQRPASPFLFL